MIVDLNSWDLSPNKMMYSHSHGLWETIPNESWWSTRNSSCSAPKFIHPFFVSSAFWTRIMIFLNLYSRMHKSNRDHSACDRYFHCRIFHHRIYLYSNNPRKICYCYKKKTGKSNLGSSLNDNPGWAILARFIDVKSASLHERWILYSETY